MVCSFIPFVLRARGEHIETKIQTEKEKHMNWVFEAYSNAYNTAMMNGHENEARFAVAKQMETKKLGRIARLFGHK
jgi:hypothetical protein